MIDRSPFPPPFGVDRRSTVQLWEWTHCIVLAGEVGIWK